MFLLFVVNGLCLIPFSVFLYVEEYKLEGTSNKVKEWLDY